MEVSYMKGGFNLVQPLLKFVLKFPIEGHIYIKWPENSI